MSSNEKDSEGVPLLQQESNNKSSPMLQQQQQPSSSFDGSSSGVSPPNMMMPPGSYGAMAPNSNNSNAMAAYAMAAAQYEYYPPDPAAAAAAAAAMQHQMQGSAPPHPYFYQGYPPPGAPPAGAGGYPPPPPMQFMQYNAPPPAPPSRPPRHERRNSGKSPLPSPQNMQQKTYPPPPQQQQQISPQPPKAVVHSAIPPLQDIFTNDSSLPSNNNAAQGPSNYGSMSKVYNAPPRVPTSSNTNSNKSKVQPVLVRTNSSENFNNTSATNKKKFGGSHRRSNSDTPLRAWKQLPPKGSSSGVSSSHRRTNSGLAGGGAARGRSYSANSLQGVTGGSTSSKRGHRRMDSAGSVGTYTSVASQTSVVSNISKSVMFGGVDEGGRVQLHFPLEAVRLHFQPDEDDDIDIDDIEQGSYQKKKKKKKTNKKKKKQDQLRRGHLYQYRDATDYDQYEEYHRISEDLAQGVPPQWESLGIAQPNHALKACNCNCNNCNGCLGKRLLLPQTNYVLPVGDSVYKRIFDEIADAHSMPCGLFFCGHHEDVAYPSIQIAVALISILFLALMYAALVTDFLH